MNKKETYDKMIATGESERVFVLRLEKKKLEKVYDLFCVNTEGSIRDLWG